jgi:hypothetical protein
LDKADTQRENIFVVLIGGCCSCCSLLEFYRYPAIVFVSRRDGSDICSDICCDSDQFCSSAQNRSVKNVSPELWDGKKRNYVPLFRPVGGTIEILVYGCNVKAGLVFCKIVFIIFVWLLVVFGRDDET